MDKRVIWNDMPLLMLNKLGENMEVLIPTNMKTDIYMGAIYNVLVVLLAYMVLGLNVVRFSLLGIDKKSSYFVILGRNWIHTK